MSPIDLAQAALTDLVGAGTLEAVRRTFEAAFSVSLIFADADGRPLTGPDDPLDFCAAFLVGLPPEGAVCFRRETDEERRAEAQRALEAGAAEGRPVHHTCPGNFLDVAVPVVMEQRIVGYGLFGRTVAEPPDLDYYRALACQTGLDPDLAVAAARRARVVSPERVKAASEFLQAIVRLLVRAAYDTIRAEHLLELERLRDDLTHMIIHDLRTPLATLLLALRTAQSAPHDAQLTREMLSKAVQGGEVLLRMINDLLDVSKMESGMLEPDLSFLRPEAVVRDAMDAVRELAEEKRIGMQLAVAESVPPIAADREIVYRVLVNLVGNAVKFTPNEGRVSVTVEATPDMNGVLFRVTDTGQGIPQEWRDRIFDKFAQVSDRGEAHPPGTGLGLTFCKLAAKAHGGRIWVESEVGKGSTFYVLLPRKAVAEG